MREIIQKKLEEIERQEQVKILFAVEAGSRAYGLDSPASDYDVRFVYIRPRQAYLKLMQPRDVLEYPVSEELDLCGWDLTKLLRLLKTSNRSVFEWCGSPVVYRDSPLFAEFKTLAAGYFSLGKVLRQYISAAEADRGRLVKKPAAKQYLAIFRSLMSFRWVQERGTLPPVLFDALAAQMLEPELTGIVARLVACKRSGSGAVPSLEEAERYTEERLAWMKQTVSGYPVWENPDWEPLDAFFLRALEQTE